MANAAALFHQMTIRIRASCRRWRRVSIALAAFALAVLSSAAWAVAAEAESVADEEQQGARVLRALEDGKRPCADLSRQDFERVGEYAMGRMAGSTSAHRSMNDLMASMMGERSGERMHELVGRRFAGCGRPGVASFGAMMGMMGGVAGTGGPGMMGGRSGDGSIGSMMGRTSSRSDGDDDSNLAVILIVALMAALVALVAVALWRRRAGLGSSGPSPLEVLDGRFATSEIDADEYQRRRQALGGPA